MADTLAYLGRGLGKTRRESEQLSKRGGLLPSQERTRGNLTQDINFVARFKVDTSGRRVSISLFFAPQIL